MAQWGSAAERRRWIVLAVSLVVINVISTWSYVRSECFDIALLRTEVCTEPWAALSALLQWAVSLSALWLISPNSFLYIPNRAERRRRKKEESARRKREP